MWISSALTMCRPQSASLKICDDSCDPNGNDPTLQAQVSPSGQPRDLVFTDYGQAVKLAHWLRFQQKGAILNKMQFSYPIEGKPRASLVPYKNTKNECDIPNG
jgi:hypothetical protein